jgi:hypothetical protein
VSCLVVTKGVNLLHETFVAVGDVAMDYECAINQPSIEEEVVIGL